MANALILAATIFALASLGGANASSDPYRWSFRPVYVFAPSGSHPDLQKQNAINQAAEAALRDRDVVVIRVIGTNISAEFGPEPRADAAALRARYRVPSDAFAFILVGKDGGVKLRSDAPVSVRQLADVIDVMPMRRREMRERDSF